jgi:large subunit ribosomal protein L24
MKDLVPDNCPRYKRNDTVMVISGKHKGKTGKVMRLLKDKNRIVIEKINMMKRHTKPTQAEPQGGIIEKEAPLHVSKVLPVSTKTGKPMRFAKWLRENPRTTTGGEAKVKAPKKAAAKKSTAGTAKGVRK